MADSVNEENIHLNEKSLPEGFLQLNMLLEKLQRKEYEQSVLLRTGSLMAAARNRADLSVIISDSLQNIFSADFSGLFLINEDQKTYAPFLYNLDEGFINNPETSPVLRKDSPIADGVWDHLFLSNKPCIFNLDQVRKFGVVPSWVEPLYERGLKEILAAVIYSGERLTGFLCFYSTHENAFDPDKLELLTSIAGQLGTGMCNVLANEMIEKQLREINEYKSQLEEENTYLKQQTEGVSDFSEIIGDSEPVQKIHRLIKQVAPSDSTVLILGETGTGKELVARAIHETSSRSGKLMIRVNCGALPASLIESELFGHEKGSFTGAVERRIGKFELANNSTIFLDEIGELSMELQVKLLRVLQEMEIERVGGRTTIKVDVRVISATNRDLQKEVEKGKFRSDLYYRLNVFPITMPALRERPEDMELLTHHFIKRYARNTGKKIKGISNKVLQDLRMYHWPGNVRELQHLIERSILLTDSPIIRHIDLPISTRSSAESALEDHFVRPLEDVERDYILHVLRKFGGRVSGSHGAAIRLGIPPTTLISKMQKLGIKKEHFI